MAGLVPGEKVREKPEPFCRFGFRKNLFPVMGWVKLAFLANGGEGFVWERMSMLKSYALVFLFTLGIMMMTGCTTWRTTKTDRTAVEQLLLSTSADRAMNKMELSLLEGRSLYLDTQYLECYDKPYVMGLIRSRLARLGPIKETPEAAEVVVEARSGALAIDSGEFLIGIPPVPMPIPFAETELTLKTPEIALFKYTPMRGRAKFALLARERETGKMLAETGILFDQAHYTNWIVLFVPFHTTNIWKMPGMEPR